MALSDSEILKHRDSPLTTIARSLTARSACRLARLLGANPAPRTMGAALSAIHRIREAAAEVRKREEATARLTAIVQARHAEVDRRLAEARDRILAEAAAIYGPLQEEAEEQRGEAWRRLREIGAEPRA